MDIGAIDRWATGHSSFLHRASALSKLLAASMIIAAVVIALDVFTLAAAYLAVAAAIVATRLPAPRIMLLAAYPAIFAVLFAVSQWDGTLATPLVILLKALAAALTMVMVIVSTPYPQVFSAIRPFLPRVVADGLFLTYRSLFILLALMDDLLAALRLRGGLSRRRYVHNVRSLASGLGLLLIRALELSERLYDVLRFRGYAGHLAGGERWREVAWQDAAPLGMGLALLGWTLAARFYPGNALQYNGYLLLVSILALVVAVVLVRLPQSGAGRKGNLFGRSRQGG